MSSGRHPEILPVEQQDLLHRFNQEDFLVPFYVAGGTALELGHRLSLDFDFFTPTEIETPQLLDVLHAASEMGRGESRA